MHRILLIVAALFVLGACDPVLDQLQGTREPCATASGTLLGCDDATIDSPEEACFRLVHCGAFPLHRDDGGLDWDRCVRYLEVLQQYRYNLALACIQHSSCDQLKRDPEARNPNDVLCLDFGDQL